MWSRYLWKLIKSAQHTQFPNTFLCGKIGIHRPTRIIKTIQFDERLLKFGYSLQTDKIMNIKIT